MIRVQRSIRRKRKWEEHWLQPQSIMIVYSLDFFYTLRSIWLIRLAKLRGMHWYLELFSVVRSLGGHGAMMMKYQIEGTWNQHRHTVDGRNPAPPVIFETPWKMGSSLYQLVSRISSINNMRRSIIFIILFEKLLQSRSATVGSPNNKQKTFWNTWGASQKADGASFFVWVSAFVGQKGRNFTVSKLTPPEN